MKPVNFSLRMLLILGFIFFQLQSFSQKQSADLQQSDQKQGKMKTFLIERDIPGAGLLTAQELKGISQKSCSVLTAMGPQIKWMQSYVTGNKIFCVYQALDEKLIKEHAQKGGFPITKITEINTTISPVTAEQ